MQAIAAQERIDPAERRLRRVYPLVLMSAIYKQFWITVVTVLIVLGLIAAILGSQRAQADAAWLIAMLILVVVAALVFLLDHATRRVTIVGGICWLLLGLVAIVPLIWSLQLLTPAIGAIEKTIAQMPLQGALLLATAIVGALFPIHYLWVIFRGAFALLGAPRSERETMREPSAGTSFASRFLVGLWGLPSTFEFVRRPRLRFLAMFVLAILTSFCFSVAIVLAIAIVVPVAQRSDFTWLGWVGQIDVACDLQRITPRCRWVTNVVLQIGGGAMLAIALLFVLGAGARVLMRRLLSVSLDHVQRVDARPPVLFLRAFGDDQVPLKPPRLPFVARLLEAGRRRTNLDRMLLDEATAYGPVVALGNPKDRRPPYGAARGYFDDKTWQEAVADLASNSICIVICIDDTDGIWWEVEHLTAARHLAKTLFLVHPKHAGAANAKLVGRAAAALNLPPEAVDRLTSDQWGAPGVIAFYLDGEGRLTALRSSTFSRFAFGLALRSFLRRPVSLARRVTDQASARAETRATQPLAPAGGPRAAAIWGDTYETPPAKPRRTGAPALALVAIAALIGGAIWIYASGNQTGSRVDSGEAARQVESRRRGEEEERWRAEEARRQRIEGEVKRWLDEAERAIRAEDWPGAEKALAEAKRLKSDHPEVAAMAARFAAAKEVALKRRAASELKPGRVFRDCAECPELVVLPAGTFTMGSPASEPSRNHNEGPQHQVSIDRPFALGRFEVTFAEFDACVADGGCKRRPEEGRDISFPERGTWGRGRQPVVGVNWSEAKDYVAWLSRKTGKSYRLPSEAEWEYGARAGTTSMFFTGSDINPNQANFNGQFAYIDHRYSKSTGEFRNKTVPVGSFAPNAFGLHDMHGNVWEWVEDCWNNRYLGAPQDGGPWLTGTCDKRVIRGGGWRDFPWEIRSASRSEGDARYGGLSLGFRVARALD